MKKLINIILVVFVATAIFSGCNEPSDPDMNVMATGSWELVDLMIDDQVIANFSSEFTLNLHDDESCVFIDHDGIGFAGTWSMDAEGTSLQLTPSGEQGTAVNFTVVYLKPDKMGLKKTVDSPTIGNQTFTYILEKGSFGGS